MPRSNPKAVPPRVTDVEEDIWDQSQLIAESAVFPKAVATLEKTELVTEDPSEPMVPTTTQIGFAKLIPEQDI
jgi:hypothetical protein